MTRLRWSCTLTFKQFVAFLVNPFRSKNVRSIDNNINTILSKKKLLMSANITIVSAMLLNIILVLSNTLSYFGKAIIAVFLKEDKTIFTSIIIIILTVLVNQAVLFFSGKFGDKINS